MVETLAFTATDASGQQLRWILAGAIIVLGLFVIGLRDLSRFSLTRVLAISGVCFTESVRRRVYWVIPLAIIGVVAVTQLTRPSDEQDAIRQTTKFCLFAAGLVVTLVCVILACTNLPKEIENRVIFTIVTKPTTRLEIVLGKIAGFAWVSGSMLLILGLFTWGYLQVRASLLRNDINERLSSGLVEELARPTLQHYAADGLLSAKGFEDPIDVQFYAAEPDATGELRWFNGSGEQDVIVPFDIDDAALKASGIDLSQTGLVIATQVELRQFRPEGQEWQEQVALPATQAAAVEGPSLPASAPTMMLRPLPTPTITFNIFGRERFLVVDSSKINNNKHAELPLSVHGQSTFIVQSFIEPDQIVEKMIPEGRIYVQVTSPTPGTQFGIAPNDVHLYVPGPDGSIQSEIKPAGPPIFRGRSGTYGLQLKGSAKFESAPVAIFRYNEIDVREINGQVPFELRVGIERSGADATDADIPTHVSLVFKGSNGETSPPVKLNPENNRTSFFSVPAQYVKGGTFEVLVRCLTADHWLGLREQSLSLVSKNEPFGINLFKSLLILWLMAILVVVIAIFCSTFVSWPIAVVLTLVILLGHWGVMQLGDGTAPGIGNQIATDLKLPSAPAAKVVSSSVEVLARLLNFLAAILPDISQYSATEDIERGVIVANSRIVNALSVTFGFGVPLTVLAYVMLKRKEVAP